MHTVTVDPALAGSFETLAVHPYTGEDLRPRGGCAVVSATGSVEGINRVYEETAALGMRVTQDFWLENERGADEAERLIVGRAERALIKLSGHSPYLIDQREYAALQAFRAGR